jgi:hypothetical protein
MQKRDERNGEKSSEHVYFAMSKIDELYHAVNHGIAHGYHRIYPTNGQSVDQLL